MMNLLHFLLIALSSLNPTVTGKSCLCDWRILFHSVCNTLVSFFYERIWSIPEWLQMLESMEIMQWH